MSLAAGHIFANFEIVRELGRGATGTVYLARQINLGRECALKVLATELVRDGNFLERFRREGKIAASLRHRNIVRIFDLVEADGSYAIAMDYIKGRELQQMLEGGEKLSLTRCLHIMIPIFETLEYAHSKGVVHRDIKPANILIEDDGDVYLTDFSIARMAGGEKLTQTGTIVGTPEYMAPEQFEGKEVDGRADLYAAALIFYEMLAGVNPFRGETLAEVVKKQILDTPPLLRTLLDIPAPIEAIIAQGLSKDPNERIQTAAEFQQTLKRFLTDTSTNLIEPTSGRGELLQQFLTSVESGDVSMDDAILAREAMKEAIDRGFKRQLSIVMLDLAGSSKIKVPNQTLIADRAFRDYRATINAILEEHGCERYDWSGDGAIALFIDPIPAVAAAVKVQLSVAGVGQRHAASLPDSLKVRIGIRTGMVYHDPRRSLGEFASRTVDQAGHLEKDCPPGMIHLGEETAKAVGNRYPIRILERNRDDVLVHEIDVAALTNDATDTLVSESEPAASAFQAPVALTPALTSPSQDRTPPLPDAASEPSVRMSNSAPDLFRPRNPSSAPVDSNVDSASQGKWWGWRYLGLAFFLFWGSVVLNRAVPIPPVALRGFNLFLILQILLLPFYIFYTLATRKFSAAKQAAAAFAIFTFGYIYLHLSHIR